MVTDASVSNASNLASNSSQDMTGDGIAATDFGYYQLLKESSADARTTLGAGSAVTAGYTDAATLEADQSEVQVGQ